MKKILFILSLTTIVFGSQKVFCQKSTPIDCSKLPAVSTPALAVNDMANIIDQQTKTELEKRLQSYWNSDSIAICIATIKTLDNYDQFDYSISLAECWGVGGKDDRGILLFIALDEKKISIRTGYGMEPYLTDLKSGRIIDAMKPYFKSKEYSDGIEYTVDEIISICNDIPIEEKTEASRIRQAEVEKQHQENLNNLLDMFFYTGLVILFLIIFYQIYKIIKKNKIRKQIKIFIQQVKSEIAIGEQKIKEASTGIGTAPSWVKKEVLEYVGQCERSIKQARKILEDSQKELNNDPMQAESLALESSELVEKSFKSFLKFNEGVRAKVKKFRVECPIRLSHAQKTVSDNMDKIFEYINKGYRLDFFLNEQKDFKNLLQNYQEKIADEELYPKIYTDSELVKNKSLDGVKQVKSIIESKILIDRELPTVIERATNLYQEFETINTVVSSFKEKYPRSVWEDLDVKIKKVPVKLSPDAVDKVYSEIKELNGMEKQKFQSASLKFTSFDNFIADIVQLYKEVRNLVPKQEESRKQYQVYVVDVEKSVNQATDVAKDTDVATETRNNIKNLSKKLRDLKIDAKKSIVDWVGILVLLSLIQKDARSAKQKAEDEISEAEESRKRKAKEEAKKKARGNGYYHNPSSVFSSYPSSNNNSGGFGGFGGGSFGGGGADGGW